MRKRAIAASAALLMASAALPAVAAAQEFAPPSMNAPAMAPIDPLAALPGADQADVPKPPPDAAPQVTSWVIRTGDNGGLPFMVIDKVAAEVWVFDAQGQFIGQTPALVGMTPGDESVEGVGDRELSQIKPADRTTPAGRFVAKFGTARGHENVLWVDYATSISLHPVVTRNKAERRPQRLKSPTSNDNRITYGCINVPPDFYKYVVRVVFKDTIGLVYILPEMKTLSEAFPGFRPQVLAAPQEAPPAAQQGGWR
jgi:hypothetical protein